MLHRQLLNLYAPIWELTDQQLLARLAQAAELQRLVKPKREPKQRRAAAPRKPKAKRSSKADALAGLTKEQLAQLVAALEASNAKN